MFNQDNCPSIYVGTYSKYNNGSVAGAWMELNNFDSKDEFISCCIKLHGDEKDPEFMFQDWDHIPSKFVSESSLDWAYIEAYKEARKAGCLEAFKAYADYFNCSDYEAFQGCYHSESDSEIDFATSYITDTGLLEGCPEQVANYFDYESFARDLFIDSFVLIDGFVFCI